MGGFAFGIPALFIGISSTLIGGAFLVGAFIDVVNNGGVSESHRKIPTALYTLTASVIMDMVLLKCAWAAPTDLLYFQSNDIPSVILAASFVLVIITMILVRKNSGPGTGLARIIRN
jgi:hypothetical protein